MKIITLLFTTMLCGIMAYSQNGYVGIQAGYGLGTPGFTGIETNIGTKTVTSIATPIRLAGGINLGLGIGFITKKNWGVDFNFTYQNQLGQTLESTEIMEIYDENGNSSFPKEITSEKYYGYSFRFSPSLRFQADYDNLTPFVMVGPSVLYSSFAIEQSTDGANTDIYIVEELSNEFSFGGIAGFGIEKHFNKNIHLFGMFQFTAAYISPARSEIIELEIDGRDILSTLNTAQKELVYENQITSSRNPQPGGASEPSQALRQSYSYNAVNFLVGMRVSF